MELQEVWQTLINGRGEQVSVEQNWCYPILKSSDLRTFQVTKARKQVIVTQEWLSQDIAELQNIALKLVFLPPISQPFSHPGTKCMYLHSSQTLLQ